MQEISNSLRQRLGARPQPETHPDPDVLTAYVEQVLPAPERAEVVLHLSECSHCREVVSLSLPQAQPEQVVLQVPSRARFWIPAFRLGAVAAMVVVAATLMIEKPWRTQPIHSGQIADSSQTSQPAASSQTTQPVPPSASTETASTPAAQTTPSNEAIRRRETEPRGVRATATLEVPAPRVAQAAPLRLGGAAAAPESNSGAVAGLAVAQRPVVPPPAPLQPVVTKSAVPDGEQDFVNRDALRQEKSKDKSVATDASSLPPAPSPQESNGQTAAADGKAVFPAVKLGELPTRTDYVPVEPPKTSGAAPPSGGDSRVKNSPGFGYTLKSKVEEAVNTVKKAAMLRSGGGSSGSGFSPHRRMASPDLNGADVAEANMPPGPQYRIGPDGILMRSTDYTRWHQAYPQGPDLQFKVVLPKGDQVWAGGNNGTLIHSWNGGVNWETMKVPDPGDITSITIDDGWQVKTSNGQTFVSQDHGKTWVPLQAEPK